MRSRTGTSPLSALDPLSGQEKWRRLAEGRFGFIAFYYIDTSVLLENIPLVKFIKTTSGPEWFIFHNLTREFIDDVISVISLQNL